MHLAFLCAHLVGPGPAWGCGTSHQHIITAKRPRGLLFFLPSPRQYGYWGAAQHGTLLWNGVNFGVSHAAHRVCLGKGSCICNPSPTDLPEELRLYSPFFSLFFNFTVIWLMKQSWNVLWAGTEWHRSPRTLVSIQHLCLKGALEPSELPVGTGICKRCINCSILFSELQKWKRTAVF